MAMVAQRLVDCADRIGTVAWAPQGHAVVAGALSGETVVIDVTSTDEVTKLAEHTMGTLSVDWSSNGVVASGGQDGVVRLWSPTSGPVGQVDGSGWCQQLRWDPAGRHLAAAVGADVIVVDADGTGGERHVDLGSTVSAVEWSPNGQRVGAAIYGGVRWFEPGNGEEVRTFDWKGSMLSLAVAPTGKWVAAGTQEGTVRVYRLWSADDLEMTGYPGKVTVLGWTADGNRLSVADNAGVTTWNFTGRGPAGTRPDALGSHGGRVTALQWSSDRRRIATGCTDHFVRVFSGADRSTPDNAFDLGSEIATLRWSPDGVSVAVGCADGGLWILREAQ